MPPLNPPMDSEVRRDELIIEVRAIWHWSAKTSMAKGFFTTACHGNSNQCFNFHDRLSSLLTKIDLNTVMGDIGILKVMR